MNHFLVIGKLTVLGSVFSLWASGQDFVEHKDSKGGGASAALIKPSSMVCVCRVPYVILKKTTKGKSSGYLAEITPKIFS